MAVETHNARQIFLEAVEECAPEQWPEFLDSACGANAVLRERVEMLLKAHGQFNELLDGAGVVTSLNETPNDYLGTQVGPYKILQKIGEGGMGTVFMAEQTKPLRRKVALKIIKPGMDSQQVVTRFEAERQALAMMDHVNIARVFDGGATESGRPYFVMELVHGVPITTYCDDNHLSPRERLELFVPVCQAIQHAHQKGIIHRDLKPSNVMVTMYDGKPVPKVIDFGVAKAAEQKLTEGTLFTLYGTMIGTLEYMSPEQAEMSALGVDTRSDIYSLGVLLYELLTGSTPISKRQLKEAAYPDVVRMIKEQEPPKPSTRLNDSVETRASISANRHTEPAKLTKLLRRELDWIVMKALDKDRNRRYATANALARDVQRYLRDEPVEASPPSTLYRFRKFARRNKRGLLTVSAVALVTVLTAAVSGTLVWRANLDLHESLDRERQVAYHERVALAEREWGANNLSRMEELLDECPEDLRGWEWRYLKRLRFGVLPPLRHDSPVYSVEFSPDSRYLATATKDGFLRLWSAMTGEELQMWHGHEANATCLQFSPNGRYLVSGGWDAQVKVWDVEQVLQGEVPQPRSQIEHTNRIRVWSVAFSPDGELLVTAGGRTADQTGEVTVWDLKTRQVKLTLSSFSDSVRCVRFRPDGRQLATSSSEGRVQLWDAQTGQEQFAFDLSDMCCGEVAFSPDGGRIAVVAGQLAVYPAQEVKVWDTHTGEEVLSHHGHVGGLRGVAFSPDGRRLASAGLDQTVKVCDATTGQEVLTLRGHMDYVHCVTFSPDGNQLASASFDRTVRIWDATPPGPESGQEYLTISSQTGAVTDVAFHPTDGRTLASANSDGTIRVWDFLTGKLLSTLPGPSSRARQRVTYSTDGRRLAVVNGDLSHVRLWDVALAKESGTFTVSSETVLCAAFSPDGALVASAGFDFNVQVWDSTTAQQIQVLEGHNWPIFDVEFSPDGRQLVSCSGDSTVRLWDRESGRGRILEPRHLARVVDVAFSRDGTLVASASWDRTVKVWDVATRTLLYDLDDPTGAVQCVAFSRDRGRLAWGSTDGTIKVWDGPDTQTQVLRGHSSWVQAVAFSLDGKWIASASLDRTVKVWHAPPMLEPPAQEESALSN